MVVLAAAFIVTGFILYYTGSWLASIGSPRDAFAGFLYYSRISQVAMWMSAAVLLVIANVILWSYRRAWAVWTTLLFTVVFLLIRFAWLDYSGLGFADRNGLPDDGLRWGFLMAVIASAAVAGVAYFDVFLVSRLRDRMHPPANPETGVSEQAEPAGPEPPEE